MNITQVTDNSDRMELTMEWREGQAKSESLGQTKSLPREQTVFKMDIVRYGFAV